MSDRNSTLKDHMSSKDRQAMGKYPTWHSNCIAATGVARPGKTNRDKARRGV